MRKLFLKLSALLFVLTLGVNAVWAQEGQPVYVAAFKAQSSAESTGTGTVKLTWVDAQGELFENTLVSFINYNPPMPYGTGNPSNSDTYASSALMMGLTLTATESVEDSDPNSTVNKVLRMAYGSAGDERNLFMTPFAYFKADAVAAAGSYFDGWTFNDPKITRQDTAMDATHPESAYFKVLPDTANYFWMTPSSQTGLESAYPKAIAKSNIINAVFKIFLLSNPQVVNGKLDAVERNTATLQVSVDVEGDTAQIKGYDDFETPSFSVTSDAGGTWSCARRAVDPVDSLSATKRRYHYVVTYTASAGITKNTTYQTTLTIQMKGGEKASKLNIPLSVDALDAYRLNATLYSGNDKKEEGFLKNLLGHVGNYSNPILVLNRDTTGLDLSENKTFTLNLNGNSAGAISISKGTVTIAYSKFGGEATSLDVTGGKAILNGGTFGSLSIGTNGTVEQNGALITGAVTNNGTLTTTEGHVESGLSSAGTLTINGGTFEGATAIDITSGTATLNKGTISGTSYGIQATGGTTTITSKLVSVYGGTNAIKQTADGTVTLTNGKFDGANPLSKETNDLTLQAGYFKKSAIGIDVPSGKKLINVLAGTEYNEGYRYFIGDDESAQSSGVGVCRIGATSYAKLEDAIAYANNNPTQEVIIFMLNDYTLPAGNYTLPAKATLVVPMSDTQAKEINKEAPRVTYNDIYDENKYLDHIPSEFRRLTFASGVNMEVLGAIEVTCTQLASNETYTGQPYGPYGRLALAPGSHITLQSGAELRAWGFVTGDGSTDAEGNYLSGEIDARRGSKVREMFQIGDWKGAMTSVKIVGLVKEGDPAYGIVGGDDSDKKIFPVTQYFIQNVESPVKYHPGAVLSSSAAVSEGLQQAGGISVSMCAPDIKIIGVSGQDQAIFLMGIAADAENTWVRKWYDSKNDVQTYEVNSAAHIGSMVLNLGEISLMGVTIPVRLNSAKFDLPLTSNFKIHLLSGEMEFEQNTSLLPGAEVEVDKGSTVKVSMKNEDKAKYARWKAAIEAETDPDPADTVLYSGAIYVYDNAQWAKYAYQSCYTKTVRYAASWEGRGTTSGKPDKRNEQVKPADAAINVHGTFNTAEGYVYTSAGGANIFSSDDQAGTFIFNEDASIAGTRYVYQVTPAKKYEARVFTSAKLKNAGVDDYTSTDLAEAGDAYCYQDGEWSIMKVDENDDCFMVKNHETFYAKPDGYVAINATKEAGEIKGNDDHTYSDAAGTGRLFILMHDKDGYCQWWEVEKKDNLYHCLHPDNDTYYYWGYDADQDEYCWMDSLCSITWKNWNGDTIQTGGKDGKLQKSYKVKYGTMAEFMGTKNPEREKDIDYTYDFTGWSPALGRVTSDVTYTATFEPQPRKYTIIFQQDGGKEIERHFLTHNEIPVCENVPTKVGHTLEWSPAIAAVTGDATYTAVWHENPPTKYTVTFYDYDGTTVLQQGDVVVGATPVAPTITAGIPAGSTGKPATSEFTYVFDHWSPAIEVVSATSIKSYTAVYREVAKKYTITFKNEDNSVIETKDYAYGETPVCSKTPTKANTAQYTYSFAWTPQIQTVIAAATYKAVFTPTTNKYTVTLQCNLPGKCTLTGAGIYNYGAGATIVATPVEGYTFVKWQETGNTSATLGSQTITGDITLTAVVKETAKDDPEDLNVGINVTKNISSATDVMNLTITSNGADASSQIINANSISLYGNADFILSKSISKGLWYCVAVPWKVEANGGIYLGNDTKPAVLGTDIEIIYYDGSVRAAQGKVEACWVWMKKLSTKKILEPGRAYMIYLKHKSVESITFRKKVQEPLLTTETNVQAYPSSTAADANWNAIANPSLFHAYINAGSTDAKAQCYLPESDTYDWFYLNASPLVVGEPAYVQAPAAKSVLANSASYAPRRANAVDQNTSFDVQLVPAGAKTYADHVSVRLSNEKEENEYVIGQDLVKFGVGTKVAQMWIDRYDSKLCFNTMAYEDEVTNFPMSVYAPKAGEYTFAIEREVNTENYALYLTYDGEAIWDLTKGAYVANLEKGTDARYGLRISAKAPQTATGIDEALVENAGDDMRKVLIGNQVFIIRGERVYGVDGRLIK